MGSDPVIESGSYPEAIDTAGNDHEKEPLDPVAEQLSAGAVKGQSLAVENNVLEDVAIEIAYSPRSSDTAGDGDDKACYDGSSNSLKDAAIPAGLLACRSCSGSGLGSGSSRGSFGLLTAICTESYSVSYLRATILTKCHVCISPFSY